MKILVRTRGLEDPRTLKDHAAKRVLFALSRFSPRLREVRVIVEDVNAQRGGVDKRCIVQVRLDPGGELRVEEHATDARVAIDRAADRAGATVARQLERGRTVPRATVRPAWVR